MNPVRPAVEAPADAAPTGEPAPAYRPEVDGLRALAVVPVVLFHAGLGLFSGGFVGVDVFFVISGYLITGILLADLAAGRYSIARFYERRARRILPALFVMLLACLPLAWALMLPSELAAFGKSLLGTLGFASNVTFWLEEGYFTTASEYKPLLHTWSLAVEEQFYLAFPLLLLVLRRCRRRTMAAVLGAACLASFALCLVAAYHFQTANFFLAPTRAWELLAGSLCALAGRQDHRRGAGWLGWAGIALIVGSIVLLDGFLPYPSHFTLPTVVGTVLLILFARADAGAGRVLAAPPLVGVGLISYSLYLWHQPLLVFARLRDPAPPAPALMAGLCLAALLLAWASWRFVEQPFRRRSGLGAPRPALALAGLAALALAACGLFAVVSGGMAGRAAPTRDPHLLAFVASGTRPAVPPFACPERAGLVAPCLAVAAPGASLRIGLFGDSHAEAALPGFTALARSRGMDLTYAALGGCPPLLGGYVLNGNSPPATCPRLAERQLAAARAARLDAVFLVARWTLYAEGDPLSDKGYLLARTAWPLHPTRAASRAALAPLVAQTVAAYRRAGIRVILVAQVPQQQIAVDRVIPWLAYRPPADLAALIAASAVPVRASAAFSAAADAALAGAVQPGVTFARFDAPFRTGNHFAWGDGRAAWYTDRSHLSATGARRLEPAIAAALDAAMR
jgi:peptidoglycan/LPS O-acetylase OafA/YrhL